MIGNFLWNCKKKQEQRKYKKYLKKRWYRHFFLLLKFITYYLRLELLAMHQFKIGEKSELNLG